MEKSATKPPRHPNAVELRLVRNLDAFYAFVQKRVSDPGIARELVHDAMLKAIQREYQINEETIVSWFYRVLRNAVVDFYRARGARDRSIQKIAAEFPEEAGSETETELCRCINHLLPALKPADAELLRDVDLKGRKLADFARSKGKSENATRVKLHRAREKLRHALELTCRTCATHGCLDCECETTNKKATRE
jgi:RNA polymerase sigma factor (sigma-70 family)